MAKVKISQLIAKGSSLEPTDLIPIAEEAGAAYITKRVNGNGIINKLYAQTANSTTITATTSELTLIDGGVGSLNVPANGFAVGDSFRVEMGGVLSAHNNDTIRIRLKTGSINLGDSGTLTLPGMTNQVWALSVTFTIRAIGGAGVASVVSLAQFHILKKQGGGTQEGFAWNTINNTTFNTTISNTLNITAQFSSNNAANSIYSDIFILNKIY